MKILLLIMGLGFCAPSFALRCSTTLINNGISINEVRAACVVESEYCVHNNNADIIHLFIREGRILHDLKFIDGVLYDFS